MFRRHSVLGESAFVVTLVGLLFVLGACGDDKSATMPVVVGKRLDVAKSDLVSAGVDADDVEVVGGGALGVVDESNWTVCEQRPIAGVEAQDVRVIVDRMCAQSGAAATPTTTTTAREASSSSTTALVLPSTTAVTSGSRTIGVPNAVGMDLQDAQDLMQANGLYYLTSHDATGLDRNQVLDRNWKVCSQSPPSGTRVDATAEIDFGAVKDEENCP